MTATHDDPEGYADSTSPDAKGLTFLCPDEMRYASARILEGGEYNVVFNPTKPPTVLDIGANCGAFSVWAAHRWPGAQIYAYEPAQINFRYLFENTQRDTNVRIQRAAVLASDRTKLYAGRQNQGEASFFPELNQTLETYELPPVIHPCDLPEANVIKIDTEGCEWEILNTLITMGRTFDVIMFEYHGDEDRRRLDYLVSPGYILSAGEIICPHRGTLKYLRRTE